MESGKVGWVSVRSWVRGVGQRQLVRGYFGIRAESLLDGTEQRQQHWNSYIARGTLSAQATWKIRNLNKLISLFDGMKDETHNNTKLRIQKLARIYR